MSYRIILPVMMIAMALSACQQLELYPVFPKDPANCGIAAAFPEHQPYSINNPHSLHYVPSEYGCISIQYGQLIKKVCGYDCKAFNGVAKCGAVPGQHCMVGAAGYIACGFDCKRSTVTGAVQCGTRYGDRCYQAAKGQIVCGLNCHVKAGDIVCERVHTFRYEFPLDTY